MSGLSVSTAPPAEVSSGSTAARRHLQIRIILLACGAVGLLTGLYGGLWRLGWDIPHAARVADLHGPLIVSGLFGTLISLERVIAFGHGWLYAAPALAAVGTIALLVGAPPIVGMSCYVAAAAVLVAASHLIALRQPALFTGTLLFGAFAWLVGNTLWLAGAVVPEVVGWWLAFLILTIAGERLELSRVLQPKRGSNGFFLFAIGLLVLGARNGLMNESGATLFGLGLLVCGAWLLRHDIACRNIRRTGQPCFFAACMLLGYAWLGVAGALLIGFQPGVASFGYDLTLHAVLIGFVMSMVFGHALIILPAVTGWRVRYHSMMYAPLAILHGSLLLRVVGGLAEMTSLRLWSGPLTVVALVAFLGCMAAGARPTRARVPHDESEVVRVRQGA